MMKVTAVACVLRESQLQLGEADLIIFLFQPVL